MRALAIGASSFIGAYTVEELGARGIEVVATGRNIRFAEYYNAKGIPYIHLDLRDSSFAKILERVAFDAVILFAALLPANVEYEKKTADDTAEYFKVNVLGTLNILEYCRTHGIKKILAFSSQFDTRLHPLDYIITEDSPLHFSYTDDHAAYVMSNESKRQVMEYYRQKYGLQTVLFRLPTIFGVGPHGSFCKDGQYKKSGMQLFMEKAARGEDIEVFGDPQTAKDILYVKDLAVGVRQALESKNASGFYNIGYEQNFPLIDIVKAIVRIFSPEGRTSRLIMRPDKPNSGGFPHMSVEKAQKDFGWQPQYVTMEKIMEDYKAEMERGVYGKLFGASI